MGYLIIILIVIVLIGSTIGALYFIEKDNDLGISAFLLGILISLIYFIDMLFRLCSQG